ncbi:MAG: nuclear transport factor 2 family protein [Acetobacteraceae bacterium]
MADDIAAIHQLLGVYLDGLYEGDTDKLGRVFHECAHLFAPGEDGALLDWPRAQWFDMVRSRPSPRSRDLKRNDFVVTIDRSGPATAFAKLHCAVPPRFFTDYLTLVKLAEGWRIVSKTYHTDMR